LTSLAYSKSNNATALPSYSWTYDALGNMATATNNSDGTVTYSSDSTGELLGASASTSNTSPAESYAYDTNGNRTTADTSTYVTGPDNELLNDGTYTYSYDAEGNQTARWIASTTGTLETQPGANDTDITIYTWDNRNRLTSVTTYANYNDYQNNAATQTVAYTYDAFNRWIGETINAGTANETKTVFAYDGNQIVMQFDKTFDGTGGEQSAAATDLSHRYLWGPAVDQLLADEQVSNGLTQPGSVVWTLGDNQNTIRDLATYNSATDTTTVVNHRVFSAYGQLLSQTNPSAGSAVAAVNCLFAYTGEALSSLSENPTTGAVNGLQNNGERWYDSITGRWLSQDPSGSGPNLYEYCGNGPTNATDPSGLFWSEAWEYTKAAGLGLAQGGANLVNGVQDGVVGLANVVPLAYNNTAGRLGGGSLNYVKSPDWSKNRFVAESQTAHNISKFLGGQGVITLATAGAGTALEGAQVTVTTGQTVVTGGGLLAQGTATVTVVTLNGAQAGALTVNGLSAVGQVAMYMNGTPGGGGGAPSKTNAQLRKEWEAANQKPWPKDPANGWNQDVSHIKAKADGGANTLENIEPKLHADHVQDHIDAGDFKRWGARGGS
jgi:RHS repeat-associated protein